MASSTAEGPVVGSAGLAEPNEDMSIPSQSSSPNQHQRWRQFETDTVSASSDVPLPPSTNHQQYPYHDHQQQPLPHHKQQSDLVRSHSADVVSTSKPVTSTTTSNPSSVVTPRSSLNHIKRKPLSSTASPVAARISQGSTSTAPSHIDLPKPDHRFSRSGSIDSPTLYEYPSSAKVSPLAIE